LEVIRRAYAAWVPYEREPRSEETSTLKVHLNWFLSHPSEAMNRFCESVCRELLEELGLDATEGMCEGQRRRSVHLDKEITS